MSIDMQQNGAATSKLRLQRTDTEEDVDVTLPTAVTTDSDSEDTKSEKSETPGSVKEEPKSPSRPTTTDTLHNESAPLHQATPPPQPTDKWKRMAYAADSVGKFLKPVKHWFLGIDPLEMVTTARRGDPESGVAVKDPFLSRFALGDDEKGEAKSTFDRIKRMLVVDPSKSGYYYWTSIVALAILYNLVLIVGRFAFDDLQTRFRTLWFVLDYFCDTVFLVDILAQSRKAFLEQGLLVSNGKRMLLRYLKSSEFVLDLISILPTDFLYLVLGVDQPIVRINRIIRIHRLFEFANRMETRTSSPNTFRLSKLIVIILICFHWNACLWFTLGTKLDGLDTNTWGFMYEKIENPKVKGLSAGPQINAAEDEYYDDSQSNLKSDEFEIEFDNLTKEYLFSFYWSALTLMTIGEQEEPVHNWHFVFHTIDILFGLLLFATIIGNVGEMITNMNQAEAEFQDRIDGVKLYMRFRKVNTDIQTRVISWFHYIWSQKQSIDEDTITASLPTKLKAELAIQVHMDTLKHVRIFQDCEAGLLVELVLKLKLQVFSPGDYICRKGDVGKEMYIVKKGCLNVVAEDGTTVFVTLKEGSVFGELSVLNIPGNKTGNKRTASVRSVGYSDLFVLSKDDLWEALREYPDAKKLLLQKGRSILMKDGLIDTSVSETEEKSETLDQKLSRIERQLKALEASIDAHYAEFNEDTMTMKQQVTGLEMSLKRNKRLIKKGIVRERATNNLIYTRPSRKLEN